MVFQLFVVLFIPVILGIVVVQPFDTPKDTPESLKIPDKPISSTPEKEFFYFFLMIIWLFFLIRILLQIKQRTFKLQRKF